MKINIMTLFPEMFEPIRSSMIGRAADNGIIELNIVNIRDYTEDKHCRVDDTPFGGGAGMLMQVQPIISCYRQNEFAGRTIYMSPRGRKLSQETAEELADERALTELSAEEISIGDYVLTGGELPAMVLVDAVARFIPGVLASDESVLEESIYSGLLEYPQYTRPRTMEEGEVPEVLLSGDHKKINLWRFEQAMRLTRERTPDMWQKFVEKFRADEKAYSKKERLLIESVIRD